MAATVEGGREEDVDHAHGFLGGHEACGQNEHVCIVVGTREARRLVVPTERRTDALVLVERHADTVARTTEANAGIDGARLHGLSQRMGVVGIIATVRRIRTKVADLVTQRSDMIHECTLYLYARVIAGKAYR